MTDNTPSTAAVGVLASLLPLSIGLAAGWPIWVNVLLMLAVLVVTVLLLRARNHYRGQAVLRAEADERRRQAALQQQAPSVAPVEAAPPSREITSVPLPSLLDGIPFTISCQVHWHLAQPQLEDHADPGAIAVDAVLSRATQVTRLHHPEDGTIVHALASPLGHAVPDAGNRVIAWATQLSATVDQTHRDQLRELAALRRQGHEQAQRIANDRQLREYLSGEVLTDVGSTVVWWLARDVSRVRETVDLIGTLARLSAAATNSEIDELYRHLVPGPRHDEALSVPTWQPALTDEGYSASAAQASSSDGTTDYRHGDGPADVLLPDPGDSRNTLFGHQFADTLDRFGHSELAEEARRRYRTIEPDDSSNPPDDGEDSVPFFTGDLQQPTYPAQADEEPADRGAGD